MGAGRRGEGRRAVIMTERPGLVVLAPLAPSATGNGLAMRIDLLVQAAAVHHDVHLLVVPVAGELPDPRPTVAPASSTQVPRTAAGDHTALVEWLAVPRWRPLVDAVSPLPDAVAAASPVRTARLAAEDLGPDRARVAGVLACRLSLALAGAALAAELGVPLVVDADDDDEALHRQLGDPTAADAWHRVAAAALPLATLVLSASAVDARGLAERHGVRVEVVPNAVPLVPRLPPPPGHRRLLMLGNLTYRPNVDGAGWLVREVLPRLPGWTVDLVGAAGPAVTALAGPAVVVHGPVPQVAGAYAGADVVAVPLHHGAGTRIKVLEAFAHRRPVVATTVGARGLAVAPGEHLLLADEGPAFAAAVEQAAAPARSASLVEAAHGLVTDEYSARRVVAAAGALLRRVTTRP